MSTTFSVTIQHKIEICLQRLVLPSNIKFHLDLFSDYLPEDTDGQTSPLRFVLWARNRYKENNQNNPDFFIKYWQFLVLYT